MRENIMYYKKYVFTDSCGQENGADAIRLGAEDVWEINGGYGKACGFLRFRPQTERPADRFTGSAGWQQNETGQKKAEQEKAGQTEQDYEKAEQDEWNPEGLPEDCDCGVEVKSGKWPLRFGAAVPEIGIYAVTVEIRGGKEGIPSCTIYSGRRNTVRRDVVIAPGETFTYRYYVHVCEYIPVMGKPPVLDQAVYVSVLGTPARLSSVTVEKAEAPTVFIGGDSIVADYEGLCPYNPLINGGSWGHNLLQYFDGAAVVNQAHGGMTTNCFRDDGHWDIVKKAIRPGDVFLFQFGHNDQKRRNLAAFTGYSANLRWYVRQVRQCGAVPVIVTSMSRMPGKDENGWFDLLEDYAEACRRVGREWKVPVIDLHQFSFELFCGMEREELKGYFNDAAHTNDYGAVRMAEYIADQIREQRIEPLCGLMNGFRPPSWIPDETLRPTGQPSPTEKPEKPILPTDLPELPYADCRHIRQLNGLKEAMARGLLDPCLKFYHPFDEMPRGQFLYLFFKAAKAPQRRPYQGYFCDIYRYEFDASAVQAALDAELIDETTTPDCRFRPDDGLTGGELVSFIVRNLHEPGDRNLSLPECERQAKSLGLIWEGYGRYEKVNRADCTVALVHMMNVTAEEKNGLAFCDGVR